MTHDLQELMHRSVRETAEPDPERLALDARRRGLAIRRRRQALGLVGAAVVSAVLVGGVGLVGSALPGAGPSGGPAASQPTEEPLVRATGRTTAAVLVESLGTVAYGQARGITGQGGGVVEGGAQFETSAHLRFEPADGSGLSEVEANVRPASPLASVLDCGDAVLISCQADLRRDGSTLLTYENRSGAKRLTVASLTRTDGVTVVVSSSNGLERRDGSWARTRARPLLTKDQLAVVVARPAWGLEVPASYVASGDRLDFTDVDADNASGWIEGDPSAETDPEG